MAEALRKNPAPTPSQSSEADVISLDRQKRKTLVQKTRETVEPITEANEEQSPFHADEDKSFDVWKDALIGTFEK